MPDMLDEFAAFGLAFATARSTKGMISHGTMTNTRNFITQ